MSFRCLSQVSQRVLVRMLERLGVKKECLVVTEDGKQVIEAEKKQRFDIILLDIQMVRMCDL